MGKSSNSKAISKLWNYRLLVSASELNVLLYLSHPAWPDLMSRILLASATTDSNEKTASCDKIV